jgi:hypothetical protein
VHKILEKIDHESAGIRILYLYLYLFISHSA